MADTNNDVEKVKVVDEPITSKIAAEEPAKAGATTTDTAGVGVGSGEGEAKDKGFWDKMREQIGVDEKNEGLNKAKNKIKIKLNKFGTIVAETEQSVYYKYKLNDLMTPEEIHEEKAEIVDDFNTVMETRIKIFSAYGDIINLVFDILSHVVTRAFRFYQRRDNPSVPNGSPEKPFPKDNDEWEQTAKQSGFSVEELKKAAGVA